MIAITLAVLIVLQYAFFKLCEIKKDIQEQRKKLQILNDIQEYNAENRKRASEKWS